MNDQLSIQQNQTQEKPKSIFSKFKDLTKKKAKIMIADDDELIRQLLKDLIELDGHKTIAEAVNGEEAIEKFKAVNPDIALLDVAMPEKDGFTVLQEIKRINPDAKVIMITGKDSIRMIQNCMDEGALAYISKPFDSDEVRNAISFAFEEN